MSSHGSSQSKTHMEVSGCFESVSLPSCRPRISAVDRGDVDVVRACLLCALLLLWPRSADESLCPVPKDRAALPVEILGCVAVHCAPLRDIQSPFFPPTPFGSVHETGPELFTWPLEEKYTLFPYRSLYIAKYEVSVGVYGSGNGPVAWDVGFGGERKFKDSRSRKAEDGTVLAS